LAADRKLLAAAFAAITFLTAGPARAAVDRPTQTSPAANAVVQFVPAFAWTAVKGADKYEFQIAADPGMNSPVLGTGKDDFYTHNTRATLLSTIPNGTYWWRVRASTPDGSISPWTAPRPFKKQWNLQPAIQTPSAGAALTFPANPAVLRWSGVAGAAHYLVSVASDPTLGSLVFRYSNQDDPNGPPNVAATSAAVSNALAQGSYFWSITPVDAEGNRGAATPVNTFSWLWPSATTPHLEDLQPGLEVFDPRFSWDPVPGAARYEVEINSSVDFAPGSKVCCTGTTIATSLSPTTVFKDNVYYWRVKAFDPDGNAGVWNYWSDPDTGAPGFTKTFDKVPPAGPVTGTAVKNVHMRDNLTDNTVTADADHDLSNGYSTRVPIVAWDPVPGASSYEIQVADWNGSQCLWPGAEYVRKTSVPEWAPLGVTDQNPVVWQGHLAADDQLPGPLPVPGSYCFRVRARSDRAPGNQEVWGDYTYLQNGNTDSSLALNVPSFTWSAYPNPADPGNAALCNTSYVCSGDYLLPVTGSVPTRTPFFTWKAIAGAQSYFVVVAKDQNFSNIVDEAFTWIPAYAPRNAQKPTTYTDETTSYYWAVLPSNAFDGSTAPALDSILANPQNFQKQSVPPTLLSPGVLQPFLNQPTFRWTPVEGARRYRLQVASDQNFSNLLDDVTTDATSYSSNTTYPADTVLYWRVRADDENLNGLRWSQTSTFQKRLAAPVPSSSNLASSDMLPVWAWAPVQGASSYDITIDSPDGRNRYYSGFRTPAVSFIKMTGTGVFHWRVRAEFPEENAAGSTPGPWSATQSFTRTIGEPGNPRTDSSTDHVLLSWNARLGVKYYKVQISATPDFTRIVEQASTDNLSFAPTMLRSTYANGGTFYWRVAGVDEDNNQGDWTEIQQIRLQPGMRLSVLGLLLHKKRGKVSVTVRTTNGGFLGGVRVKLSGRGFKTVSKRTNAVGKVVFKVRAKRKGKLLVTATKAGYQPAYGTVRVK
jgi:hypothetical protein